MSLFERAYLYVFRKKSKTALLLLILLALSTFALTGLSIHQATKGTSDELRKTMGGSFKVGIDMNNPDSFKQESGDSNMMGMVYNGPQMDQKLIDKIKEVKGIKDYNAYNTMFPQLHGLKTIPGGIDTPEMQNVGMLQGSTKSELDDRFANQRFKLIEGRHIKSEDRGKVLINKELAKKNNLKVGDKITTSLDDMTAKFMKVKQVNKEVEIVGIFEDTQPMDKKRQAGMNLTENLLFSDPHTTYEIVGEDLIYEGVNFFVNDPAEIDKVIEEVKKIPEIKSFTVNKNDKAFKNAAGAMNKLNSLTLIMLIVLIAASVIILSLILTLWIRSRIHETGILMSVGISKFKIVLQYITEIAIIAVVAFGLSYFSSQLIAQSVGNQLMKNMEVEDKKEQSNKKSGGMNIDIGMQEEENVATVKDIDVKVQPNYLIYIYSFGMAIIVLSVSAASVSVIRLKPKEIFSKMS